MVRIVTKPLIATYGWATRSTMVGSEGRYPLMTMRLGVAWVNHPENRAIIKAHHDEREALLATAPTIYEAGWATNSTAWVRVRLELADAAEVFELLEEAWRMTATKRAIKAYDEALGR
jgi:hypothetical protein